MSKSTDARSNKKRFGSKRAYRRWLRRQVGGSAAVAGSDMRQGLEALEQRVLLSASPVFELSDLLAGNGGDGSEGVIINGVSLGDRAGISVSAAGDINGDGFDDVIIGAFRDAPNGADSGASFVVFGQAGGFSASLQLSSLNGTNGFKINGVAGGDFSGRSVAGAGDVNNDGFDDLLIGAFFASPNGTESGQAYVVYGKASGFSSSIELSALNGTNGFTIDGVSAGDRLGFSVRGAGDINGDGIDDFILGAALDSPNGAASGSAYVVFGQDSGFGSSFDLTTLNGVNGLVIEGVSADDQLGISVNAAGDVNGDGLGDLVVGAFQDDPNGGDSGAAYVVFGKTSGFSSTLDPSTLNGSNGFTINGGAAADNAGRAVSSVGDFNGDGFADILIGAPEANGSTTDSGSAYVVFGHAGVFASSINLSMLTGTDGFRLNGIDTGDRAGLALSGAGDVNGDGLDDLLVAAVRGDTNGVRSGETYLVFGRTTAMPATLNLSALSGADGFVLNGINASDSSATSVRAAGDVDGDGFGDFIIGAFLADPNGGESGESYLVFGGDFSDKVTSLGTSGPDVLLGTPGADVIVAGRGDDLLVGVSVGAGVPDVLLGGQGNDELAVKVTNFIRIDGGSGTDTLTANGTGITFDLTAIADSRLTGIEVIDISGGTNTLTLNHREVLNISDTSNTLRVTRNINGTVHMGSGWTQTGSQVVNGNEEITYTQGHATLVVTTLADQADPVVTVDALATETRSPELTGTVTDLDPVVTVDVTVNGTTYAATVNGDGTWTLPAGTISPDLADGVYEVLAVGTDTSGNDGSDQTFNDLTIDNAAPVVTIDPLVSGSVSPELTGTVDDVDPLTTISVTVNSDIYSATNNGDGTWTLSAGTISPALPDAVYDVAVTGTDTVGHIGTDATSDELTVDTTDPVVTIDAPGTQDSGSPELTGTVIDVDNAAQIVVLISGTPHNAINNGNDTWILPAGDITPALAEGSYTVDVLVTDAAGNVGALDTLESLDIDTAPVVTVDTRTTSDTTPELTGTIVDADTAAAVTVTVNGTAYSAVNNGDGTWTLVNDTITPALSDGVYDISVSATDVGSNVGSDSTTNELTIDTAAPTVTVDTVSTQDSTPHLSGTVSDAESTIQITVNGKDYAAVNNGDGTWDLADGVIPPADALAEGVYDVTATATNLAAVPGSDATTDELTVDQTIPVVGFDGRTTSDTTPELTGTVTDNLDPDAAISVDIIGVGLFTAVNNGDGTWTLPNDTISPALAIGTYDVTVRAIDAAGNLDVEVTTDTLEITDAAFLITVDPLTTNDGTPQLTGLVDDPAVTISVNVNGIDYVAVNNGNGTWTLADNTIAPALADGTYEVVATGTLGLDVEVDETTNELTIDTIVPVVTIDPLTTSDTTPALSGTIDDATAGISVLVNGNAYVGVNNGDGTWTLADNTISPALPVGTYNVQVTAVDGVGNIGADGTIDELLITNPTVSSIDLEDLLAANGGDGTEGVVFNGVAAIDLAGNSASSAGDINGDGYDDLIIGATGTDPVSNNDGTAYVIFGQAGGFAAEFDLSTLNGTNGFRMDGLGATDDLGVSVASAGDLNGDGLDDLVIGASKVDAGGVFNTGAAYIVYGQTAPFAATLDLSTLNGSNGFRFDGEANSDRAGFSVHGAGDVNGDGLADVMVGTIKGDDGVTIDSGRTYILFGSTSVMPAVLTAGALTGANGFIITGPDAGGQAGFSVSSAGDMNGDGIADLRIGAPATTVGVDAGAGKTFVVFGQAGGFLAELNMSSLNGTNGFAIEGNAAEMELGFSGSSIGDFNGDGYDDLLVSAPASSDGASAGSAYVIYGQAGAYPATVTLASLNGTVGFAIQGVDAGDYTGYNVSGVGDVNGDGYDDLLIGASKASGGGYENGESYLVFGRASGIGATLDLSTVPGNGGIVFNGDAFLDQAGRYVSGAGDVNGDGYDDLLVAARNADISPNNDAGQTYLIFGRDFTGTITQAGGTSGEVLTGTAGRDAIIAGAGDDELVGNGGPDILSAGQGDDTLAISDTAFVRLAGGNGFDTLRLDGAGMTLDLTAVSDRAVSGIEQIDVRGTGANSLTLDLLEVLNLSDTSNTLRVLSDTGDTVDIGAGWTPAGQEVIDTNTFDVFTQGNATVKVFTESTGIVGDLDGDGFVGITDLNLILSAWNQTVPPANPAADPSGDNFIGIEDLNFVLGNWNAGTPPAAPSSGGSVEETAASTAVVSEPVQASVPEVTATLGKVSLVDEVASVASATSQGTPEADQGQTAAAWGWMVDGSRSSRTAFVGDTEDDGSGDSVLDLAEPMDDQAGVSRL